MSHSSAARRMLAGGVALLTTAALACVAIPEARADAAVAPMNATIVITGAGWGHGIGMSQYGAYGAADAGLSHEQILAFYYPGTKLAKLTAGNTIRVWISSDTDNALNVLPAKGQRVRDSAGRSYSLPTGSNYRQWRIKRSGSKRVLQYLNAKGSWVTRSTGLSAARVWSIDNPTRGLVTARLPGGRNRDVRGKLALRFYGSGARTVNTLGMESYLRGVVPAEMPTSWHAEAVRAQAVAARSYAARFQVSPKTSSYDLCDTTACQVYSGQDVETSGGNAAVAATANQVLKSGSAIALTMFSSSNGGHSADGGTSYLVAKADPYDGRMRNQKWSAWFSSSAIQKMYPAIGTLRSVQVAERDGDGAWGGRAERVLIAGSKGSISLTGAAFRSAFGLKERLFGVHGGLKPGTGNHERWQGDLGGTTGRLGGPSASEVAIAGGLYAQFEHGALYWSKATGSRLLTGRVASTYRAAGGPVSALGFPTTDVAAVSGGTRADFQHGRITCPGSGDCVVDLG
ncbi:MAG: SpoIID/LytB domain-containing protein [Micropruina sp.]|nr:SpoIID/LytB domain-containing protein [Micropruina sp.]